MAGKSGWASTPPHFSPSLTYCAVVAAAAAALVDIIEQGRRNISGRLGFVKKCALNVKYFLLLFYDIDCFEVTGSNQV